MQPEEIDRDSARQHLQDGTAVFVDVRDPQSYQMGHIPGAEHVNDAQLPDFLARTGRDATLIVYCYHGIMSMGGAAYFRGQGFADSYSLPGGFEAWRRDALPQESGAPPAAGDAPQSSTE